MMRRARPLFLLAILLFSGYLFHTWRERLAEQRRRAPAPPAPLPRDVAATAQDWTWEKSAENGPAVSVRARSFRQVRDPDQYELEHVELKIYRGDGTTFDHIVSDRAVFDLSARSLYSEGRADITMGVADGEQSRPNRLIRVQSSGIRFDSATGKAETEREATFQMERGEGRALGAVYDPTRRELLLKSQARVTWYDRGAQPRPMVVEAEQMLYQELEQKVALTPWARLTRGSMTLEGAAADVHLSDHGIREVRTTQAKGVDRQPSQLLRYEARQLILHLNSRSEVEHIEASGEAKLETTSSSGSTKTGAERVDLRFAASHSDSVLETVRARGQAVIESHPAAANGDKPPSETRVLRSEAVDLRMRPGGQDIETLNTPEPAVLDFLPNHPSQPKRRVEGERIEVAYGRRNEIDLVRVSAARTRTERPNLPPSFTQSREMVARFAPGGALARLEQWGDFQYEEGDRRARSERALLDQATGRITLIQNARVWDASGSTSADEILLDQRGADYQAQGNVTTSRLPDKDKKDAGGSSLLARDEPVQARATRMITRDAQSLIIYEGQAVLWQGASRIEADRIEIDRKNSLLRASGKVMSQLLDRQRRGAAVANKPPQAATYLMVWAPSLLYDERLRLADYTGGATLNRAGMDVRARRIRAYLKEDSSEGQAAGQEGSSSLDRAIADGAVVIVQSARGRTRKGTSDHAEYYPGEEKVILEGGDPVLDDSLRGTTRGRQLTYYANEERLLVNGVPAQPAVSKIRRK